MSPTDSSDAEFQAPRKKAGARQNKTIPSAIPVEKPDVYFICVASRMDHKTLASRRRGLRNLLIKERIRIKTIKQGNEQSLHGRLNQQAGSAVVIAIDDEHPLPSQAAWFKLLDQKTAHFKQECKPKVIYVTHKPNAAGRRQTSEHDLLQGYVQRDEQGRWMHNVALKVTELCDGFHQMAGAKPFVTANVPEPIIGQSQCYLDAVNELTDLMQLPYGMVWGEVGAGKLHLLKTLWFQDQPTRPMQIISCGTFFKDYYHTNSRRQFGGGFESIDELKSRIREAQNGMLVLHHVEKLPLALQDELATQLSLSNPTATSPTQSGTLQFSLDVRKINVIATSTDSPQNLAQNGRLLPDLARKFIKRNVMIPSLAQRGPEDVQLLFTHLLQTIHHQLTHTIKSMANRRCPTFTPQAMAVIRTTRWPGNLSDMTCLIEQTLRRNRSAVWTPDHLRLPSSTISLTGTLKLDEVIAQAQLAAIENALAANDGDVPRAAEVLGRNAAALYRLMRQLGMKVSRTRQAQNTIRKTRDKDMKKRQNPKIQDS